MQKKLYQVLPETQEKVDVARLVSTAHKFYTKVGILGSSDQITATSLLSDCALVGTPEQYQVMKNNTVVGHLKKGVKCDYIYYEGASMQTPMRVHYMVYGDPAYDILDLNPSFNYEQVGGKVLVTDTTTLNSQPYKTAAPCRAVKVRGRHFSLTDKDGIKLSVMYLGGTGYSQLGSSPEQITISKTDPTADYVWSAEDVLDIDKERLNLQVVYAVKNETNVLSINLEELPL